jgi:hypothetical protein
MIEPITMPAPQINRLMSRMSSRSDVMNLLSTSSQSTKLPVDQVDWVKVG